MSKRTALVSGIVGATVKNVLVLVKYQVKPRFSVKPVFKFDAWVYPSYTSDRPRHQLHHTVADKYKHLAIVYPSFFDLNAIDIILGAELFFQILNCKRISDSELYLVSFGTVFGWVVIGLYPYSEPQISISCPASLIFQWRPC